MICGECGGKTCLTCDTIWHPDLTCAEAVAKTKTDGEARLAAEKASANYLAGRSKLCPKCQIGGDKVEGCDHMTCKSPTDILVIYVCLVCNAGDKNNATRIEFGVPVL